MMLADAGVEALFADLGHFSRPAIQLSTYSILIPSLFLTYLGQGAYLIHAPEDVRQTGNSMCKGWGSGGTHVHAQHLQTH